MTSWPDCTPIGKLEPFLSVRAWNTISNKFEPRIANVGELRRLADSDLRRRQGLGKRSLSEIRHVQETSISEGLSPTATPGAGLSEEQLNKMAAWVTKPFCLSDMASEILALRARVAELESALAEHNGTWLDTRHVENA